MFDTLQERLGGIFDGLTGRGALTEKDVDAALREVRVALLEADVALPVVKDFVKRVKDKAVGEDVIRSVSPGQQVIKIVHDALVDMLGGDATASELYVDGGPPSIIMMAGLQGSGKTTTAGKIALRLRKQKRRVLLASLDTRRPAAMEQLATLAKQAEVDSLPIVAGQTAVDIARRALKAAELGGHDVLILDTAGRTSIDEDMMAEAKAIADLASPHETLLVADSLTGQDAVETASRFHERLPLTGLVLTRIDGDGRGGAALSMRAVTGLPIKLLGVSEKMDGLEAFDPKRIAGRILGQGDVVSLVEKAAEQVDRDDAEKMAKKLAKGKFDLEDMAKQLKTMQNMGGLGALMGLMPGMGKMKKGMGDLSAMGFDDKGVKRQEAIILSMTPDERRRPEILKASRKRRIARGSGVDVADVNRLLKMHRQMADLVKMMGKKKGGMGALMNMMGGAGGPGGGGMNSAAMKAMQVEARRAGKGGGQALPGLPGGASSKSGSELPGLPGGFPGGPLGSDGLPIGFPPNGSRGKK